MNIFQWKSLNDFHCLDDDDDGEKEEDEKSDEPSKLQAKKAKLKSAFDAEYDQSKEPDSAYLDDLKKEVELQSKVPLLSSDFVLDT